MVNNDEARLVPGLVRQAVQCAQPALCCIAYDSCLGKRKCIGGAHGRKRGRP